MIDEFMGHQSDSMRKRYPHLFPKNRRSAIKSFSLTAAQEFPPGIPRRSGVGGRNAGEGYRTTRAGIP